MIRFETIVPLAGQVDRDNGIISGVSVITRGEAIGHDVFVDAATLESVRQSAEQAKSVKVKFEHGTNARDIVGTLKNFRNDGNSLRGDLKLIKASPHFPMICEMGENCPEVFGLSIVFKGESEKIDSRSYVRCQKIFSADLVDFPAANPTGLFSVMPEIQFASQELVDLTVERVTTLEAAIKDRVLPLIQRLDAAEKQNQTLFEALQKSETDHKKAIEDAVGALRAEMASADILAARKLAAMGVPAGTVGAHGTIAPPPNPEPVKSLSQQLAEIKDPLERYHFLVKHKLALFAETQAAKL